MSTSPYSFRTFTAADLPLAARWLAAPHVVEWWGEPAGQLALLTEDLETPAMAQFVVLNAGRPFAYIQSYDLASWPDPAYGDYPAGTRAIDQFIGEADMVGRGHGGAFVRDFSDQLIAEGAPRVITDPDPANARAIRAYEKAGFAAVRIVETTTGPGLMMVKDP